jgi:hypothetical protein
MKSPLSKFSRSSDKMPASKCGIRWNAMTLTIEIPAEIEARLEAEAGRRSLSKNEFVRIALEEKLNMGKSDVPSEPSFKPRILARNFPSKIVRANMNGSGNIGTNMTGNGLRSMETGF